MLKIQYHLGMASLEVGDRDTARKVMTLAATSPTRFARRDEARKAAPEAYFSPANGHTVPVNRKFMRAEKFCAL